MRVRRSVLGKLLLGAICLFVILAGLLWFVYRPWALNWGATEDEISRAMVGDEIVASPNFSATRAVTVDAPPKDIWPWIVQMGYRKAGFYSWDKLDNDGVPSAEQIFPEYQGLAVGDSIPLDEHVFARVVAMDTPESMLWVIDQGELWTWAWGLYPLNERQTRLVTRLRVEFQRTHTKSWQI